MMPAADVAPAMLAWWDVAGRGDLPWQTNPTPYRVWVSEIMLQQTQVATVERYYDRFIASFPDVVALADADSDAVMHVWSGLGYYARARNLHRAARRVRDEFDGVVPENIDALIELPGIGRSTAGAILALSRGQRHPILDGNARRVLARLFGVEGWTGSAQNQKRLWDIAEECTPGSRAAHYTQAIMDLGATVCTRGRPGCNACPLASHCRANVEGLTGRIPAPRPKRKRDLREAVVVMLIRHDGAVLLERRPDSGIWGGLWCFPEAASVDAVENLCLARTGVEPVDIRVRPVVSHSFTHFDFDMTPVEACVEGAAPRALDGDRWLWYKSDNPAAVGLAAPVARMLESVGEER